MLINITGGQDITLPELAISADIIKKEVGDDANIIFGSSYDEALQGKIRVSIVVTGINDNNIVKEETKSYVKDEPSLIDQSYDDTTFVPTVDVSNYNSFSEPATDIESEEQEEEPEEYQLQDEDLSVEDNSESEESLDAQIEELSSLSPSETISLDDDFASLDKSEELPEVPQASALFTAIMKNDNKVEENEKAADELSAAVADEDFFSGSAMPEDFNAIDDDEPILFKNNDTSVFKGEEEKEFPEVKQEHHEPVSRPSFIERVIGIRTRRKNNDDTDRHQEVRFSSMPEKTGTDDDFDLSSENLDLPSFLRRK